NLTELLKKEAKEFKNIVLISNTPYYITSEILFKSFENSSLVSQAVFMLQKEVAERVCATIDSKKYNNLSITTEFYSKPKYEFTVKRNLFNPVPKVDSAMVSLDFTVNKKTKVQDDKKFVAMVRELF